MAGCCNALQHQFDARQASRDLRRYRRKGPNRATRILLDAIRREGVREASLLDIGGGIGAIQHALLRDGARSATDVDASSAYLSAAREEAIRQGHSDRLQQLHGDFVELAHGVPEADIVTLDRVICCYPDMERLVSESAARARRLYGIVLPRSRLAARLAIPVVNLMLRLRGDFRAYIHPTERVDALVRQAGLTKHFERDLLIWRVALFSR